MLAILFLLISLLAFWYDAMEFSSGGERLRNKKVFRLWQFCAVVVHIYGTFILTYLIWEYLP